MQSVAVPGVECTHRGLESRVEIDVIGDTGGGGQDYCRDNGHQHARNNRYPEPEGDYDNFAIRVHLLRPRFHARTPRCELPAIMTVEAPHGRVSTTSHTTMPLTFHSASGLSRAATYTTPACSPTISPLMPDGRLGLRNSEGCGPGYIGREAAETLVSRKAGWCTATRSGRGSVPPSRWRLFPRQLHCLRYRSPPLQEQHP